MQDYEIVDLYWARDEEAIAQTDSKYGNYCRKIAINIVTSAEDTEECVSDTWLSAWQTGQSKLQSKVQSDALTIPGDSSLVSREVFLETSLSGIFQFRHTSLLGGERAMGLWVGGFFCLGVQEKPV